MTGDERYTKEFLHQMKEFGIYWPAKPFMEDDTFETKFKFPGHAWRTIETAMRIYTVWLPCMEAFRRSKAWDSEGWQWFLTQLCDHADFLMGALQQSQPLQQLAYYGIRRIADLWNHVPGDQVPVEDYRISKSDA